MTTVITVDGPSGAGKGTLCQLLARETGYALLDSGALYRLTALAAINSNTALTDHEALSDLAHTLDISFDTAEAGVQVMLAGEDVSTAIRQEHIGMAASQVAAIQSVRDALLMRQRAFAQGDGLVADGRDMGTVVFPLASVKFFLTASAQERAHRRVLQLEAAGQVADADTILSDIEARDKRDRERSSSPLVPASDAILLDSTAMSIEQVFKYAMAEINKAATP